MLAPLLLAATLLQAAAPKVRMSEPVRFSPAPLAASAVALAVPTLSLSPSAALVPMVAPAAPAAPAAPEAPRTLIESLTEAPLPKADLPAGEASAAAESDFMARAQLGEVHKGASSVEVAGRGWFERLAPGRSKRAAESHAKAAELGALPADELAAVAERMRGEELTEAQSRAKAVDFKFRVQRWFESFYNDVTEDFTAAPDGVCYRDSRIELFLKPDWRKYPSLTDHFRVLITHEYAHRLQNEGLYTRRWGVEIPAVAVELLRAVELAGLDRLKKGHISFIGEGVLGSFESGRAWARSSSEETMGFYSKGFLAGAAHELALKTGRPDDAWEFVRRVSSGKKEESPRAVYDEIAAR